MVCSFFSILSAYQNHEIAVVESVRNVAECSLHKPNIPTFQYFIIPMVSETTSAQTAIIPRGAKGTRTDSLQPADRIHGNI